MKFSRVNERSGIGETLVKVIDTNLILDWSTVETFSNSSHSTCTSHAHESGISLSSCSLKRLYSLSEVNTALETLT